MIERCIIPQAITWGREGSEYHWCQSWLACIAHARLVFFVSRAKNKLFFFRAIKQFLTPMTRCILQMESSSFQVPQNHENGPCRCSKVQRTVQQCKQESPRREQMVVSWRLFLWIAELQSLWGPKCKWKIDERIENCKEMPPSWFPIRDHIKYIWNQWNNIWKLWRLSYILLECAE